MYETGRVFRISRATYCGVSVRVKGMGSSCPVPYRRWRNPLNSPSDPTSSNFGSGLTWSTIYMDKAVLSPRIEPSRCALCNKSSRRNLVWQKTFVDLCPPGEGILCPLKLGVLEVDQRRRFRSCGLLMHCVVANDAVAFLSNNLGPCEKFPDQSENDQCKNRKRSD